MSAEANNYLLQYLDKEMTIMGILSTFSAAVVALVLDRIGSAEPTKATLFNSLWQNQSLYVVLGSLCFAAAAAGFYSQRSALAWFYGQISLSIESPAISGTHIEEWYKDADSWATWVPYQIAFTSLTIGCIFYGYALVSEAALPVIPVWLLWLIIGITVAIQTCRMLIFRRYKDDDDPIARFFGRS